VSSPAFFVALSGKQKSVALHRSIGKRWGKGAMREKNISVHVKGQNERMDKKKRMYIQ